MKRKRHQLMSMAVVFSMLLGVVSAMIPNQYVKAAENRQRTIYLSDLEWESATKGSEDNEIQKDLNFGNEEIKLLKSGEEIAFKKGIGTHAESDIVYNIKGKGYTKFEAWAGVDRHALADYENTKDNEGKEEGIIEQFSVLIDGAEAEKSGEMNPAMDAFHFEVEIPEDAERLTLHCTAGSQNWSDWADWADAKFYQKYPEPSNAALASKGTTAKAVVTETGDAYDAAQVGGNTDPAVQIDKINDGVKDNCLGGGYFDFGSDAKRQSIYVEYDLQQSYEISSIDMWRYWLDNRTYSATTIVVSDEPEFSEENSTVVYNSDTENVHGWGNGTDEKYQESSEGHRFTVPEGTTAQYVRVYTYGVENGGNTNHIVELEVNAFVWPGDVEIPEPEMENPFHNAEEPLNLEGPGTDNQVVHPDVVVFDEPWNGYQFWMGYTPNKTGTSYYENPCIAASNDEISWEVPEGLVNPIQPRFDSDQQNENEHNCDTDLLYDKVNDRLILYWEWAQDEAVDGKTHCSEIRYRVSYDGVNWGTPIEGKREVETGDTAYGVALRTEGERYSDLSPTFVYDENEQVYKMWANDAGNGGYNNPTKSTWYLQSENPLSFSQEVAKDAQGRTYVENFLAADENGVQMLPWHLDVQWIPEMEEYWAVVQAFPQTGNPDNSSTRLSKSADGIHWTPVVTENGRSKAILQPGADGTWDDGQIYRATFRYEPAENGAKNGGTFHIWYSALSKKPNQIWKIGYTSANYQDAMEYLTGQRPDLGYPETRRIQIDNEHPLLIMPLYGKSYDMETDTAVLDWGDTLVERWAAVPEDLKDNVIIELHLGGKIGLHENDSHTAKAFYENQLKIAEENNIPVMLVVATAGQQNYYTGVANLGADWMDEMFKKYSCLKGLMSTENYWTDWQKVAKESADYLRVAHENGGYYIWSEHQEQVIEGVLATEVFRNALETYGDSFIFTWKNTPAGTNSNAGTASYMQGLWLTGMIDQWGGLADTWKWYEKRFGKLFAGNQNYISGGEEARPVATEPEALLGIEMMSIYTNGGCVYNFEHPAYVYGSYNQNSPAYENVIAEFMRYAIANPAPTKEEVLADTNVVFYGRLSQLKNEGNLLQQGINWEDATLPTQITGRYGLIPAVPKAVEESYVNAAFSEKTIVNESSKELQKDQKKEFFESKYPETYTGDGFAQKVKDTWYLYNSNVNVDEEQKAKIPLSGEKKLDVTMTPHTYAMVKEAENEIQVSLNNYRVDKDAIWERYGEAGGPNEERWDTDHNTKLQDWVRDTYIPNPTDDTFRTTTFELTNVSSEPTVKVTGGLENQYEEPVVVYDKEKQTALVTVESNGYVYFTINLEEEESVPEIEVEITVPRVSYEEGTTIKVGRKAVLQTKIVPDESTDTIASFASDNEEVAVVDEEGVVTGVGAGTAVITATTTSGVEGTIEIHVLPKQDAGALRHEISAEKPLYLENYYWSDDFADKNGVSGNVPQEERVDSPVMLWETVPDSLKENTVILLIAERSLNNTEEIKQWIKDNVELCNANGIPCAVQAVNGETKMADPISIEFYEELAKNNEMLVGYNGAELYNRFNGSAGEYMVDLIQMCVENGLYMLWTDTNIFGENGVLVDWFQEIPELSAVMRENKEHIVMMYKESYGQPNTDALYLGMWLTEYCGNWGIASDWWHWQLDDNGALFDAASDGDPWKQCLTWPEAMYTQDMLRAVSQGATCFKSEAQWYSNATKGMRTPGYQYSILPFLEKLANGEYKIPTKEEVAERTKAIVVGRGNWHDFNYNTELSQLYPGTAKYGIVPFVPENCPEEALEGFDLVIRENLGSDGLKAALDEIYTSDKTAGTAWTETFGDTYYFMNSSEDKEVTQNSVITPKVNSSTSLEITAGPHTYGVIKEGEDTISLSLGNYRIDKTELWTDSKYAGGFSDMDCYEYVWEMCERMKTDTNHDKDLRTTTVKVVCEEKPVVTFAKDNEYTRPYQYEEAWDETSGTYTLTLQHNGIVDVEIQTKNTSGEKPEGGDKPEGGEKPEGGDKPNGGNKPNDNKKPSTSDTPTTGDASPIFLMGMAAVISGGVVVFAKRRKKR